MFYEPAYGHGLPRDPFKACVVPRPIGWISTVSADGNVNLAPFSYFNALLDDPPIVMFSCNGNHVDGGIKDTAKNAIDSGEFVYNMATWDLRDEMNASSAGVGRAVDEFELAGLEKVDSRIVAPPRVAASPIQFECKTTKVLEFPRNKFDATVVFGEVVGIHIDDSALVDGMVDLTVVKPIARLGYMQYAVVEAVFEIERPG